VRQPLLALLAKEPAHGYELKLALEQTFGQAYPSPNIGQVYVTLKRLEQDGLVRSQDVEQTTRPNKRVYELTPAGREALSTWVDEPSDGPRIRDEFFVKLILAPMAGLADRIELRVGGALDTIRALPEEEQFDAAFIDADKLGYPKYWTELVPRVRPGGVIMVDNTFSHGRVLDAGNDNPSVIAVRTMNDLAAADDRVELVMVPIGDGLTVALRH